MTLPFFADRRLVIVENSGLFGADSGFDAFVKEIPETTVLVIVEQSADARTKLYKAIKDNGYICEFKTPDPGQTVDFCAAYLGRAEKRISRTDCEYFVQNVGGDLYNLTTELDKLIAYIGTEGSVKKADIDAVCSMQIENKIFDLADLLMKGEVTGAYEIYFDLLSLREQPLGILRFLMNRYLKLLSIRDELDRGASDSDAASRLRMPDWLFKKEKAKLKNYPLSKIVKANELCTETESLIKKGDISESAGMEILLANLSAL